MLRRSRTALLSVALLAAVPATAQAQTIVVRNYNVLGEEPKRKTRPAWPHAGVRIRQAAERFVADSPGQVGIIALQEASDKVPNCSDHPIGRVTATACLVQSLRRLYPGGDPWYAESLASGLGLVWDRNVWQELVRRTWALPSRPKCTLSWLAPCWVKTQALQVTLKHKVTGRVITVMDTHLAPDEKYKAYRRRQVVRLRSVANEAVGPRQLPPLLIGDMNFSAPSEPANFHHLDARFRLANDPNGIEHVWIGRRTFHSGPNDLCVVRNGALDFNVAQISDHLSPVVELAVC